MDSILFYPRNNVTMGELSFILLKIGCTYNPCSQYINFQQGQGSVELGTLVNSCKNLKGDP